jgi:hypothetical protein
MALLDKILVYFSLVPNMAPFVVFETALCSVKYRC